jgi:hypothetical protein
MPARKKPEPVTILDAVRLSRLRGLEAVRDKLASDMDVADANVVPQFAARLQAVLKEIDEIHQPEELSPSDDLARKRADRRAAAAGRAPAASGGH